MILQEEEETPVFYLLCEYTEKKWIFTSQRESSPEPRSAHGLISNFSLQTVGNTFLLSTCLVSGLCYGSPHWQRHGFRYQEFLDRVEHRNLLLAGHDLRLMAFSVPTGNTCMHAHTHMYMCMCTYTCSYVHTFTHNDTCTHVYPCMHIHANTHKCIHIHIPL